MKKKQLRRQSNPSSNPKDSTSSCSEDEKMKSATRRSSRKKKAMMSTTRDSGVEVSMVDIAYEADYSARSENSSPNQQAISEYEFDSNEDVPVLPKARKQEQARKRKNGSQTKETKISKGKKVKADLNMSTSTPVYEGNKLRNKAGRHITTPEVTPILAVDDNSSSSKNQDNSTPTLRKSLRKRSFSFQDPDLSAISKFSFDSQGDSGLGISPALKKMKSSAPSPNVLLPSTTLNKNKNTQKDFISYQGENYSKVKSNPVLKDSSMNNSCFGFDSIQTPSPVSRPKKSRKVMNIKKSSKNLADKAYRSPKNSSDSMFDESPFRNPSSSSDITNSQENIGSRASPSLFSDDIYADDGDHLPVNRVINKSYKGVKPNLKKSKPQVSKLDSWASSFNTELENIAKFDLNIE